MTWIQSKYKSWMWSTFVIIIERSRGRHLIVDLLLSEQTRHSSEPNSSIPGGLIAIGSISRQPALTLTTNSFHGDDVSFLFICIFRL